jgi:hypothetical protein
MRSKKCPALAILLFVFFCVVPQANADITLLLEEPYKLDGEIAGSGHSAVYLSGVCASSPVVLRRCIAGETGIVISRYLKVAGYDWIAIPLIPYLYAVERADNVPLIADEGIVSSLRERYRRNHLRDIIPDDPSGKTPAGNWYQLVGSAYDRTLYGFQIDAAPEMDDAFIAEFNARSNRSVYNFAARNCANFSRDVVNFYYPKAVGANSLTDLNIASPRHNAKTFARFSRRHPELHSTSFVIPQIPGNKRSKPVHGFVDSLVRSKKYLIPMSIYLPVAAIGFGATHILFDRFDPARGAMIFRADGTLEPSIRPTYRRAYRKAVEGFSQFSVANGPPSTASWKRVRSVAELKFDDAGRPFLRSTLDNNIAEVGIARSNVLEYPAFPGLSREVLLAHLREEVRKGHAPTSSDTELHDDWMLLQKTLIVPVATGTTSSD